MISHPQNIGTEHVILWEFKNNKSGTETAKKICIGYGQMVSLLTGFQCFILVIHH